MKKILAKTLDPLNGAAICRVHPLQTLQTAITKVIAAPTWNDVAECDVLMVHRPVNDHDLGIIKLAKQAGKKVWVDADDDYFFLPKDHQAYSFYEKPETKEYIRQSLKLADVVTISNDLLRESFNILNEKIITYPCSYPSTELLKHFKEPLVPHKRICWRGSQTHRGSLLEFGPQIAAASEKFPDWEWYFLGDMPWTFVDDIKGKVVVNSEWLNTSDLMMYIHSIQPSIQIMPLKDNHFTRSRSNMAWMDGLCGNAVTIAPDWPHWKVPGVYNYDEVVSFSDRLESLMAFVEGGNNFSDQLKKAWEHMLENYTFEAVNKIQKEILKGLYENSPS